MFQFNPRGLLPPFPWNGPPLPVGFPQRQFYGNGRGLLIPMGTKIGKPVRIIEVPRPATLPEVEPRPLPTPEQVPVGV